MPQDTPTPNVQTQVVPGPTGSEDEAIAAFELLGTPEQAKTDEPEPADEPADEVDTEAEAEPEETPEAAELVEVELDGKTFEVPPEVQKAILRQSDYSRKMNEVSAKEKAYTERIAEAEKLFDGAEKRAEALAAVKAIDDKIKAYEGIDWVKAKSESPADAAMAAIELLTLKDQRKDAVQEAANISRQLTESQNKLLNEARSEMDANLRKNLKGWGEELGSKITRYALDLGAQRKTLEALTDPAMVIALEKARRYDALQGAKTTLKAKATDAPKVVKPGAPRNAVDPKTDAMARLRKENTQEAAEAAFLSRM